MFLTDMFLLSISVRMLYTILSKMNNQLFSESIIALQAYEFIMITNYFLYT